MIHRYEPTKWFNKMGPIAPVLTLSSGDTVHTTTVDAWGHDASGDLVAERPNPMTGPFFVENAEPGDTLVVYLESIRPNRATGFTRSRVAANAVDPDFVMKLGDSGVWKWELDIHSNSAFLPKADFTVALKPMLGCLGTAPRRGLSISTENAGEHGGNMDFSEVCEGAEVWFPVFEPGGLFFLGDGHAVQGDGELLGTGIEISMDVTFSVELRKGQTIGWPHLITEEMHWTIGSARPLDQASQHAITEMLNTLTGTCGKQTDTAHALLGMNSTLRVANFYNPTYSVACGLPLGLL